MLMVLLLILLTTLVMVKMNSRVLRRRREIKAVREAAEVVAVVEVDSLVIERKVDIAMDITMKVIEIDPTKTSHHLAATNQLEITRKVRKRQQQSH